MPIFSYQSFNAGSSKTHDLKSLTAQGFTVETHDHLAASTERNRLIYPALHDQHFNPNDYPNGLPADRHAHPVQGPAALVGMAPIGTISQANVSTANFYEMMKQKVLQNQQAVYRQMKSMPQVTAFGELDGAHQDFSTMNEYVASDLSGATNVKAACQNFSVYCSNGANVTCVGTGEGWYAIRYLKYVVVFVHVPNRLMKSKKAPAATPAKPGPLKGVAAQHQVKPPPPTPYAKPGPVIETTEDRLVKFYKDIADTILKNGGGVIDIVMGDTNQSSGGVTPNVVSQATNQTFKNAHEGDISPIDGYNVSVGGTNSKGNKMYDVAVYNANKVKLKKICYWSQLTPFGDGGQVAAVTDHMGLAIEVE
ncbi:MAG TPA: hypothetical protein VN089_00950 [Duganella sp.]|nr:hypothetical protein [Duganella sp.]